LPGRFIALSLALMPLWVRDSHFMSVNVPSVALMVASAFLAVIAIQRASSRSLLASAFVAGLAATTKYPGGTVLVLTLLAFFVGKWPRSSRSRIGLFIALPFLFVVSFLLGTSY